jgi:hypothetical protein
MVTVTDDGEIVCKLAEDIKLGDTLRVVSNDQIYSSSVINITMEMKTGYYAPLTMAGMSEIDVFVLSFRDIVSE